MPENRFYLIQSRQCAYELNGQANLLALCIIFFPVYVYPLRGSAETNGVEYTLYKWFNRFYWGKKIDIYDFRSNPAAL